MTTDFGRKRTIAAIILAAAMTAVLLGATLRAAYASDLPQQAQASNLAVPKESPRDFEVTGNPYKYASAIVVTQCNLVTAAVFVTYDGIPVPIDLNGVTDLQFTQRLNKEVDPRHLLGIVAACHKGQRT